MIEGVTLLNTFTVTIVTGWTVILAISVFIGLICTIYGVTHDNESIGIPSLFITCCCISSLIIGIGTKEVTRYQVLIDQSISYSEVIEHYEVIEQNGLIYTIEEK